jgi:hypothetical protein
MDPQQLRHRSTGWKRVGSVCASSALREGGHCLDALCHNRKRQPGLERRVHEAGDEERPLMEG